MIVTCKSCGTKFRLNEDRIKKSKTKVRCSHCGHIFIVSKDGADDEFISSLGTPPDVTEGMDSAPHLTPYAATARPARRKSGIAMKILLAVGVLVLLAAGGFWLVQSNVLTPLLKRTPPAAVVSPKDQLAQVTIQQSVKSFFLENKHAGQIFVVQGEVINESSHPISFVLVEGKLYTENNEVVRSQRSYCGNMISKDDLKQLDMTDIQNIMMNREGTKLSNVQLAPQGHVPFMVVFHNLPELDLLKDYSVEVVSADFEPGS